MDWAAVHEPRNADVLKAHRDVSEPEAKDNRIILIVTKACGVIKVNHLQALESVCRLRGWFKERQGMHCYFFFLLQQCCTCGFYMQHPGSSIKDHCTLEIKWPWGVQFTWLLLRQVWEEMWLIKWFWLFFVVFACLIQQYRNYWQISFHHKRQERITKSVRFTCGCPGSVCTF